MAATGTFGWATIDGVRFPYLLREGGHRFVAVRMVEMKLLSRYPSTYPDELKNRAPLMSHYVTEREVRLLNEINREHCADEYGSYQFTDKDLIVKLHDFEEFYGIVKKHFPDELMKRRVDGGWVQVNNTVVPFVLRNQYMRYVPLSVIRYAAQLLKDVQIEGHVPTDAECKFFNEICASAGLKFTFGRTTKLVMLTTVQQVSSVPVSVAELPRDDPFGAAEFRGEEDGDAPGGRPRLPTQVVPDLVQSATARGEAGGAGVTPSTTAAEGAGVAGEGGAPPPAPLPAPAPAIPPPPRLHPATTPGVTAPSPGYLGGLAPVSLPPTLAPPTSLIPGFPGAGSPYWMNPHMGIFPGVPGTTPLTPSPHLHPLLQAKSNNSNTPSDSEVNNNRNLLGGKDYQDRPNSRGSNHRSTPTTPTRRSSAGGTPSPTMFGNPRAAAPPSAAAGAPPPLGTLVPAGAPPPLGALGPAGLGMPPPAPGLLPAQSLLAAAGSRMMIPKFLEQSPVLTTDYQKMLQMLQMQHQALNPSGVAGLSSLVPGGVADAFPGGVPGVSTAASRLVTAPPNATVSRTTNTPKLGARPRGRPPIISADEPKVRPQLTRPHVSTASTAPAPQPRAPPTQQQPQQQKQQQQKQQQQQKGAATEVLIKRVDFEGKSMAVLVKNNACFALMEALSRVFFPAVNMDQFRHAVETILYVPVLDLTDDEEREFIQFYGLPTAKLKCKKVIKLKVFKENLPQLKYMFKEWAEAGGAAPPPGGRPPGEFPGKQKGSPERRVQEAMAQAVENQGQVQGQQEVKTGSKRPADASSSQSAAGTGPPAKKKPKKRLDDMVNRLWSKNQTSGTSSPSPVPTVSTEASNSDAEGSNDGGPGSPSPGAPGSPSGGGPGSPSPGEAGTPTRGQDSPVEGSDTPTSTTVSDTPAKPPEGATDPDAASDNTGIEAMETDSNEPVALESQEMEGKEEEKSSSTADCMETNIATVAMDTSAQGNNETGQDEENVVNKDKNENKCENDEPRDADENVAKAGDFDSGHMAEKVEPTEERETGVGEVTDNDTEAEAEATEETRENTGDNIEEPTTMVKGAAEQEEGTEAEAEGAETPGGELEQDKEDPEDTTEKVIEDIEGNVQETDTAPVSNERSEDLPQTSDETENEAGEEPIGEEQSESVEATTEKVEERHGDDENNVEEHENELEENTEEAAVTHNEALNEIVEEETKEKEAEKTAEQGDEDVEERAEDAGEEEREVEEEQGPAPEESKNPDPVEQAASHPDEPRGSDPGVSLEAEPLGSGSEDVHSSPAVCLTAEEGSPVPAVPVGFPVPDESVAMETDAAVAEPATTPSETEGETAAEESTVDLTEGSTADEEAVPMETDAGIADPVPADTPPETAAAETDMPAVAEESAGGEVSMETEEVAEETAEEVNVELKEDVAEPFEAETTTSAGENVDEASSEEPADKADEDITDTADQTLGPVEATPEEPDETPVEPDVLDVDEPEGTPPDEEEPGVPEAYDLDQSQEETEEAEERGVDRSASDDEEHTEDQSEAASHQETLDTHAHAPGVTERNFPEESRGTGEEHSLEEDTGSQEEPAKTETPDPPSLKEPNSPDEEGTRESDDVENQPPAPQLPVEQPEVRAEAMNSTVPEVSGSPKPEVTDSTAENASNPDGGHGNEADVMEDAPETPENDPPRSDAMSDEMLTEKEKSTAAPAEIDTSNTDTVAMDTEELAAQETDAASGAHAETVAKDTSNEGNNSFPAGNTSNSGSECKSDVLCSVDVDNEGSLVLDGNSDTSCGNDEATSTQGATATVHQDLPYGVEPEPCNGESSTVSPKENDVQNHVDSVLEVATSSPGTSREITDSDINGEMGLVKKDDTEGEAVQV